MVLIKTHRDALLAPLQSVSGIVEKRHTLPILSNVLLEKKGEQLTLLATDIEIQITTTTHGAQGDGDGAVTVGARKLQDILRSLPDSAEISLNLEDKRLLVRAGKSRFTLQTLPAEDFPRMATVESDLKTITVTQRQFRHLLAQTQFSMAAQDVRYYLNGLLFDLSERTLRCVATDGHRLAMCESQLEGAPVGKRQIIVPRKGVTELQRLLEGGDRSLELEVGRSHIRVKRDDVTFTSKLIDGRFPDYAAVIPIGADREVLLDREVLRAALQRAAILSNEKYRGVRVEVSPGQLKISAHNPEQEEAQEEIEADTKVDGLAIGFNVNYLLDALSALRDEHVVLQLRDANSSALVREASSEKSRHVVMPLRL